MKACSRGRAGRANREGFNVVLLGGDVARQGLDDLVRCHKTGNLVSLGNRASA